MMENHLFICITYVHKYAVYIYIPFGMFGNYTQPVEFFRLVCKQSHSWFQATINSSMRSAHVPCVDQQSQINWRMASIVWAWSNDVKINAHVGRRYGGGIILVSGCFWKSTIDATKKHTNLVISLRCSLRPCGYANQKSCTLISDAKFPATI